MAPAGTVYRAPMPPPSRNPLKRAVTDISSDDDDEEKKVICIDDSSDDEKPSRGDIRPSSFKPAQARSTAKPSIEARPAPVAPRRVLDDKKLVHLANRVSGVLRKRDRYCSLDECKEALIAHHYSVKDAISDLLEQPPKAKKPTTVKEFIRSFTHGAAPNPPSSPHSSASPPSQRPRSPSPPPKRRRLVQGIRKHAPSSPQVQSSPVSNPSKTKAALLISLVSDDEEEGAQSEDEPEAESTDGEPEDDDRDAYSQPDSPTQSDDAMDQLEVRVLQYLNTCTVDDLVAMLGGKAKDKAKALIAHRPFSSSRDVINVTQPGKGRKNKTVNIGEDIYEDTTKYVEALQAIDIIVSRCDNEGARIRSTTDRWNVNSSGKVATELDERPATPSSMDSRPLAPLPISREPKFMRGHCTMKPYQLYGLNWLWQLYQLKFGCILADDMGLGKTCQVVSFLAHLVGSYDESSGRDQPWPNLVVVPPSTLDNWQAEFKRFAPGLKVTTYAGKMTERDAIFGKIQRNPNKHHVVLTSYSQLNGPEDIDAMRKIAPNAAVFDEGHKMKNSNTNVYRNLMRIRSNWRLILTGTPVQNNLMEMINLLNFIQPQLFGEFLDQLGALFTQKVTLQDVSNGALLFSDRVRRARSILEPFMLQRRKEQVLSSLPKKTSRVVYCDMDPSQRPIYTAYERQFKRGKGGSAPRQSQAGISGLADDQNNVWVQLRKSAIHAQLFRRFFDDKKIEKMATTLMKYVPQAELRQPHLKHLINELKDCSDLELHSWCKDYKCIEDLDVPDGSWLQSGKVQELLKLVREFEQNGDRVLVFSRFAKVINILRECFASAGIDYLTLEGQTRVQDRQALINEFNENSSIPVFLLTTGAGGTGINLTAANKVVIFDQSDNPQDDVQAENRAHRLGQTREVEIIRLITKDTIEELVYKACQKKLELAQRVTGGEQELAEDPEKTAKDVEKAVLKMLLEKDQATPPKSEESDAE